MTYFLRTSFFLIVIAVLTGCDKRTQTEMTRLEERIAELELRVRENEARLYRQLETAIAGETVRESLVVAPAEKETRPEPVEDVSMPAPEPEPMVVPVPTDQETKPEVIDVSREEPSSPSLSPGEVVPLYRQSYEAITARRLEDAERGFRRILDHQADHELAPNAMYWLGEVYYSQYNFNHAATIFARVVDRYPDSNKAPDAMLKQAMSRDRLGEHDMAVRGYQSLIARFPDSRAAELARQRL